MEEQKENKSLIKRLWEFILSAGGILGVLALLGAEIKQIAVYAIIGGGIALIVIHHIVSFFQEISTNVKYIKNKLDSESGGNDGQAERKG